MVLLLLSRAGPGLNFDGQGRADKKNKVIGPGRAEISPGRAEKFRPVQDSNMY